MSQTVEPSTVTSDGQDVAPARIVSQIVSASGTSFALGMHVLPRARRHAMHALYAFCRLVDDIVDEPDTLVSRRQRLDEWRTEIARLYDKAPTHPVAMALAGPVSEYGLPKKEFLAIIDGMEMDLGEGVRIPDSQGLELYCRRVAGAVGMISVKILGVADEHGPMLAVAQGEALQLTNILRDLAEDAGINRLYLPANLLAKHGIDSTDPQVVLAHPSLDAVCRELAARARGRYAEAAEIIGKADRRTVKASRLMLEYYRRILNRLEQRGWHDITHGVSLTKVEKIWIYLRYGF